jgi:hypothetical protein
MTIEKKNNNKVSPKTSILKLIFILVNFIILLYLYYLLSEFGVNPIIIILMLIFAFLTIVGPIYKSKRKRIYSSMFPDKNDLSRRNEIRLRKGFKKEVSINQSQSREFKPINLDITYRKPIIRKCSKCKMILPSHVKKCPICGEQIIK